MSLTQVLDRLTAVVDDLCALDLNGMTADELVAFLRDFEVQKRRLPVVDHALVVELDRRGVAGEVAARDTKTLLRDVLRLAPGEARARYAAAVDLGPRRSLTGEVVPVLFPATAAAQAAGTISPDHARVIRRAVDTLPAEVEAVHGPAVEARLVAAAREFDPTDLAKLALRIRGHLDPDGTLADDREHDRRRHAVLAANRDGSGELHAHLTPACLARWQAVLDPLAKPRPADDLPDERTPGQRLHDALDDCATRLLNSGHLPAGGGTPATVLITLTADQLAGGTGYARTSHDGLISTPEALRLAGQAELIPVLHDATGGIRHYGRTRRIASPGQRAALAARDRGCSFPGCDHPPAWCQAHHVTEWQHGGATDLDNLTLICGYHHREFDKRGWQVHIRNGLPEWTPPPHIDPHRKPRRNRMHDSIRQ